MYFNVNGLLKLLRHYRPNALAEWKFNITISSCNEFKIPCHLSGLVWVIAFVQTQKFAGIQHFFTRKCGSFFLFKMLRVVKGHTHTETHTQKYIQSMNAGTKIRAYTWALYTPTQKHMIQHMHACMHTNILSNVLSVINPPRTSLERPDDRWED